MSALPRSTALAAGDRDCLLASVGAAAGGASLASDAVHPAKRWAQSGLMALTGPRSAAPLMSPAPIATLADGALAALAQLAPQADLPTRSEEHTSELPSLMRISYAVFCWKNNKTYNHNHLNPPSTHAT